MRGYIGFVFSVIMCVHFLFIKGFSGTTIIPSILKFGTNVVYYWLYWIKENQTPPAFHSLYLSTFLSQQSNFLSQISRLLCEPESSNCICTLRLDKFFFFFFFFLWERKTER